MREIVISEEMTKQLEALPDTAVGKHFEWTPEKDAILLKYWNVKKQSDVCGILGVTENPARKRYKKLTETSIHIDV